MSKSTIRQKRVVILLPTYNEKGNVEKFINEVFDQQKNVSGWKFEILLVDDINSKKENKDFVKKLAQKNPHVHFLENNPSGLGVAVIQGHQYSIEHFDPDALIQIDADGQVEADVIPKFLQALDEGYNLVIGSRFVKGGKNNLPFSRRVFSLGASFVVRLIMGPLNIKEATNSARAFTPELFKKINLERLPWKEKTFIIQPAFLNEAILAGAKYKEVPLVFRNRAEGYSKMKVFNYTYDVIAYVIDVRLKKWHLPIPVFTLSRKKTFWKFGIVGLSGTFVDFSVYKFLINQFGLLPFIAKIFSTEVGIINNFVWNNWWTFGGRNVSTNIYQRFGLYNLVSLGGLLISVGVIYILHSVYGDGTFHYGPVKLAYNTIYFILTIPPVLAWSFTVNHFITWRHKES